MQSSRVATNDRHRVTVSHSVSSSGNIYAHGHSSAATLPQLVEWEAEKVRDFVFRRCHRTQISNSTLGSSSLNILLASSSNALADSAAAVAAAAAAEPLVPRSFLRALVVAKYGPAVRLTSDGVAMPAPASARSAVAQSGFASETGNNNALPGTTVTATKHTVKAPPPLLLSSSSPALPTTMRSTTVRIETPSRELLLLNNNNNNNNNNSNSATKQHLPASPAFSLPLLSSSGSNNRNAAAAAAASCGSTTASNMAPPPKVALLSTRDKKPLQFYQVQILMDGEWRDFLTDSYAQQRLHDTAAFTGGSIVEDEDDLLMMMGRMARGSSNSNSNKITVRKDRSEASQQLPSAVLGELDRTKNPLFFLALDITPHELDVILARAVARAERLFAEETAAAAAKEEKQRRLLGHKQEREQKLVEQMEEAKKKMAEQQQQQQQHLLQQQQNPTATMKGSQQAAAKKELALSTAAAKKAAAAAASTTSSAKKPTQQQQRLASQQLVVNDAQVSDDDDIIDSKAGQQYGNNNNTNPLAADATSAGGGTAASSRRKHLRRLHAAHQRAFNIVADELFAERDRRIAELRKTVPSPLHLRPHDDKSSGMEKAKRFYGHRAPQPYGRITTYDDPRQVQRSTHRLAWQVCNDLAEGGGGVNATAANLRCLRDEYEGAPEGKAGWDSFCALRQSNNNNNRK